MTVTKSLAGPIMHKQILDSSAAQSIGFGPAIPVAQWWEFASGFVTSTTPEASL